MKVQVKILLVIFVCLTLSANENLKDILTEPLKVYYDGSGSLFDYIRDDINFVQFVRNPLEAQIHIQVSSQSTGDGGSEYRFYFSGGNQFENINDTLITSTSSNISESERNDQLVRVVKLGLVGYLSKTPYNKYVDIVFLKDRPILPEEDKWDNWVFNIGLNGSLQGEESKKEYSWDANASANRVKEESKIEINGKYSDQIKEFKSDDKLSESTKKTKLLDLLYVGSITEHISAGLFSEVKSKTYENINIGFNLSPAVEYSLFPYEESVRKKFTFLYKIGYTYNRYYLPTMYSKQNEELYKHSLKVDYEINEIWGKADLFLEASNYLHDFDKNRVDFKTEVAFRLSGAFYFNVTFQATYVNDQLYIPDTEASLEDVLLDQIQLSTQYEYKLKFGVSYTFGSIYNTIVNTRF